MNKENNKLLSSCSALQGKIKVPGDKSISHRAVMLSSLAKGSTKVKGFLDGEDCLSTVKCMAALGAEIEETASGELLIKGTGELKEPDNVLDCGNSGTTARLIVGILAGQPFFTTLTGDGSLRSRPMKRVTSPLKEMGALIDGRKGGDYLPLAIKGGSLQAIEYLLPMASAQVKSCILLAGLFAKGVTKVIEPQATRDHTEKMLTHFGVDIKRVDKTISINGGQKLQGGGTIVVPGDISSAAFFLVAGAIVPGSDLLLENVGINKTRIGVLEVLLEMGADIKLHNERSEAGEPVADLSVKYSSLKAVEISGEMIPRLIDEIPILAVAASTAVGKTVIKDAQELRVKESDRIKAVVSQLSLMDVDIEELPDGMIINGGKGLQGNLVDSFGDHRMAMSLAIASLIAKGETTVKDIKSVDISFPGFWDILDEIKGSD